MEERWRMKENWDGRAGCEFAMVGFGLFIMYDLGGVVFDNTITIRNESAFALGITSLSYSCSMTKVTAGGFTTCPCPESNFSYKSCIVLYNFELIH
jgi:hypothetical protein